VAEKVVLLLSGGIDSSVCAHLAKSKGFDIYAITFDYGQRMDKEISSAMEIAKEVNALEHIVFKVNIGLWGGSSVTDTRVSIPINADDGIPSTYVPGRNSVMLSIGLSYAESIGAKHLMIGVNSDDNSGYPDCRPEYISAFQSVCDIGTGSGVDGRGIHISAPLLYMNKSEIIRLGISLGVDFSKTWSCYVGGESPCMSCAACKIRDNGFASLSGGTGVETDRDASEDVSAEQKNSANFGPRPVAQKISGHTTPTTT